MIYIDLGLPSGTLWSEANEKGYFTFTEASGKFEYLLPNKEQFQELIDNTDKFWDLQRNGMVLRSRNNGQELFFHADGALVDDIVPNDGNFGSYWSSSYASKDCTTVEALQFCSNFINILPEHHLDLGLSVRLIKA